MLKKSRNKYDKKLNSFVNKKPKQKRVKIPKVKQYSFSTPDLITLEKLAKSTKGKRGKSFAGQLKKALQKDFYKNLINTFYKNSANNIKKFIRLARREGWEDKQITYFLENHFEEISALETSEEILNYLYYETIL